MYDITFQQIEVFLTVAKCMNLSRAAELLSYSQPALSKALAKLEKSIGMRLFFRSNQGMTLTPNGAYLISLIEPLYKNLNQNIRDIRSNARTQEKTLRIAAPSLFDYSDDFNPIKEIIEKYENKYPNVEIQERLCDFAELRQALSYGTADFVITEDFIIADLKGIEVIPINEIGIFLVMSNKHHLAQLDNLDADALSEETLYVISTFYDEADARAQLNICEKLGIKPKKIEILPNYETLMHLVKIGKGVCFSERLNNLLPASNLHYFQIKMTKAPRIVVAWRSGSVNHQAANFISMLPAPEKS